MCHQRNHSLQKSKPKYLFAGLGTMGFPMAGHLSKNPNLNLYVFNRTSKISDKWVKKYHGTQLPSLNSRSIKFDGIITCLKDDASIASVILNSGLLKSIKTNAFIVDHSTTSLDLVSTISNHPDILEDGPTHQPVEQLASLRAIPGLQVIRPADPNETVAAWCAAVDHNGPTALILSRQTVLSVTDGSAVATGAGVVRDCEGKPTIILVGTGSEVGLCVTAATELSKTGEKCRVVSMPSWDRFERLTKDQQQEIFPKNIPVLSVEAGVTMGWERYADQTIGINRFGTSAPGAIALEKLGISLEAVVQASKSLINDFKTQ